ncbi:hypothetical protein [Micromonospora deserti]|uniref:hypothetical protein n=1 Tax=Micromonospora deserti TaxID=2070366 RepID=UPI001314B012|nr:hypothetical protein [Micromonospora deserti]
MLPAARPLTAGMIVLAALLAGCGDPPDVSEEDAPASVATSTSSSAASEAASTAPARQPHRLVLTATGTARVDTLSFVLDGQATDGRSVRLPWRRSVDVPADGKPHEWSLTVTYRKGDVDLVAIFNDRVVARGSGSSSGTGTANVGGSVRG